jgi:peptidyl-prolyl cis-trans isomerase C
MNAKKLGCFWVLVLALALASINSLALAGDKQSPEGKVATVNGVEISQKEFDKAMRGFQAQMSKTGRSTGPAELEKIREQMLDNLIAEELLYQESQRKGVKVDPKAINEQFEGMKKRFSGEEEFKNWLSSMDLSEASFKSRLERNLAIRELVDSQFGEKITVSDEEIKAYYDSNQDSFKKPEQVKASHILIKVEPKADESQKAGARKKLETVQAKLQEGEEFDALAKEYSEGPSSTNGGDLGYFGRGRMVKPFEDAAFALKPGEVSGIVETQFGYHLIKVTDKTAATTITYDEIKDRLSQYLKQEKLRKEMGLYIESLRSKAKVEVFSKKDSK